MNSDSADNDDAPEIVITEFPWWALKGIACFVLAFGILAFFVGLLHG